MKSKDSQERGKHWQEEYSDLSAEKKKGWWVSYIYRAMRVAGEMGHEWLTETSYRHWREFEPDIDKILLEVIEEYKDFLFWDEDIDMLKERIKQLSRSS